MSTFRNPKKSIISAAVLAASTALISSQALSAPAFVTNGNDSGDGSFRAALESGANEIFVQTQDDIMITSGLVYTGQMALEIYGMGQTVQTMENVNILEVSNGANLTINNLNFAGPGGWSIENRGDLDGPAGKGIFIDVADGQTRNVRMTLNNVTVSGVANHGIHISDCDLADDCGGGGGGAGGGSDASIIVNFNGVTVDNVGNGKFDADGLRVDERGAGNIVFNSNNSVFQFVGADGVELDEGQDGIIRTRITNDSYLNNGNYCDPAVMNAFVPDPDEMEFEDGVAMESDIPGPVTGSPDDTCVEREVDFYDSGFVEEYAFGLDLDDGIDLDEAGPGGIRLLMTGSTINDNLDEGVDIDEEGEGNINLVIVDSVASMNNDDGYKFTEEDAGNLIQVVYDATAQDNGGKGFVFEEADDGNLDITVDSSASSNNDDSDDTGIEAVQEDAGTGTLTVRNSVIADGIDTDGVDLVTE